MGRFSRKLVILGIALMSLPSFAQMDQVFRDLFNEVLVTRLQLSPGQHGNHFIMAAEMANRDLTPSLNSLISGNISSFPLSSTASGVTFDFSSGAPVAKQEGLGPIFAEIGGTLGKGRLSIGVNHTQLGLDKFRGLPTKDIRFTFTHVDVTGDGNLGESPNESDYIDLYLDLDVDAEITALFGTWGVTDRFDIGVAVPFVRIEMSGNALARIDSFTFPFLGTANHNFGADPTNPNLETFIPYSEQASGIGDVSMRMKYGILDTEGLQMAVLLDVSFSTGERRDFLGSGDTNIRLTEVISKKSGNFRAHLNVAYEQRQAQRDSDEIEVRLGFDHQVGEKFTWAADILAETDINDNEAIRLFPGSTRIIDRLGEGPDAGQVIRDIDLSNIPERNNDNTLDAAIGLRWAPNERWNLLGNLLVPLNDGGLRSDTVFTIGGGIRI